MSRYEYEFDMKSDTIAARVVRLVGRDKRVLELGCSSGHMAQEFVARGCQVIGLEMDPEAAAAARKFCLAVYEVNLDDPNWPDVLERESKFDVIVAADVLEHLRNPSACLAKLRHLLDENGTLVISTPNIAHGGVIASLMQGNFQYRDTGLLDRTHIHFFTEHSLRETIEQEGYAVGHFDTVDAGMDHPEFSEYWNKLTSEMREIIQRIPNAMAFQFVLSASKRSNSGTANELRETQRQFERTKQSIQQIQDQAAQQIASTQRILEDERILFEEKIRSLQRVATAQAASMEEVLTALTQTQHALTDTQQALHTMLQSSSWKITAPLRFIARTIPLRMRYFPSLLLHRFHAFIRLLVAGPSRGWHEIFRSGRRIFTTQGMKKVLKRSTSLLYRCVTIPRIVAAQLSKRLTVIRNAAPIKIPEAARPIEIDYSLSMPLSFAPSDSLKTGRVAAVVHLFYEDLASEFRSYLNNVPVDIDVYISASDSFRAEVIRQAFKGWSKGVVEVRVVPNRGRDIAPKLVSFSDIYDRYEYVLHLHGKRSHHASALAPWRHFLLESLIGTKEVVTSIFYAFEKNPRLGMVASQHFEPMRHWVNWGGNFALADKLAKKMGISLCESDPLDFPSGSMFWARSAALRPLLNLNLKTEQFDEESSQTDATLAHAIERIFYHSCEHAGFDWIKIAQPALFMHTPAIIKVENNAELDAFFNMYGFHLLSPRGVRPRATHPVPVAKPAPFLFDRVRNRALGLEVNVIPSTRVAIGLVTYNNNEAQLRMAICAAHLSLKSAGLPTAGSLFILDNGASTAEYTDGDEFVSRQTSRGNIGFGAGHNHLMRAAFDCGHHIYIAINPDGALHPDAVTALVQMMQAADGKALIEALQFPSEHPKPYDENTLDTPWVSGACLAISRSAYDDLGGFDEDFFMYCEDVDLSWRARAHGYALKTCPCALFLHSVTNREMQLPTLKMILESGITLSRKWGAPEFERWLETELSALGLSVPTNSPAVVPEEWRRYADFSQHFSFAPPRW